MRHNIGHSIAEILTTDFIATLSFLIKIQLTKSDSKTDKEIKVYES